MGLALTNRLGSRLKQDRQGWKWLQSSVDWMHDPFTQLKFEVAVPTLYNKSCEPVPTLTLQPSLCLRPWLNSWSPWSQSVSCFNPEVSPYCNPAARSSPSIVRVVSTTPLVLPRLEVGERDVKDTELNGNDTELGFPARREITPGFFSRGYRLRTEYSAVSCDAQIRYYDGQGSSLGFGFLSLAMSERNLR